MSERASRRSFFRAVPAPRTPPGARGVGVPAISRARQWFSLSPSEQLSLALILILVAAVRCTLWVLPSSTSLALVRRIAAGHPGRPAAHRPRLERLIWSVETASRRVPHASCLTQAVTAQLLLRHFGYPSQLCLGVARSAEGMFAAHAWVESRGRIIIGGRNSAGFTPLYSPRSTAQGRAGVGAR